MVYTQHDLAAELCGRLKEAKIDPRKLNEVMQAFVGDMREVIGKAPYEKMDVLPWIESSDNLEVYQNMAEPFSEYVETM